jgi:hypothetical protein
VLIAVSRASWSAADQIGRLEAPRAGERGPATLDLGIYPRGALHMMGKRLDQAKLTAVVIR